MMQRKQPCIRSSRRHVRTEVIQRRQALRKQKQEQKGEEYKRNAKVAGFLIDMDSLLEETVPVNTHAMFFSPFNRRCSSSRQKKTVWSRETKLGFDKLRVGCPSLAPSVEVAPAQQDHIPYSCFSSHIIDVLSSHFAG